MNSGTFTFILVLLGIITILLIVAYSLCVMAHDADERAEKMYKKWQEERRKNNDLGIDVSDSCCNNSR